MTKPNKRYRLRLKSISYLSAVDTPAQPLATAAIIKRDTGDEVTATVRVAKVSDDEVGIVMGWAFVCTENGEPHYDLQGDNVDESDIVKIAAALLDAGVDEQHDYVSTGSVAFAFPITTEIAAAMAIKSERTGLMVGIRPSPEVLAKFKDGSLTGFSIAGIGEREEVTKSALTQLEKDARIRELEQQIREAEQKVRDQQVAKAIASVEKAKARDAESLAWINGIAKDRGIEAAREVAGYNVAKAGAAPTWADRWLEANPLPAEVLKAAADESAAQIFKRRTAALEQATRGYETGREAFAKRVNKSAELVTGEFLHTPEGAAIYAAYCKAQQALTEGEPGDEELALEAEIERLTAELATLTERHSLDHDLEPVASRERLRKVSPTYKAKQARLHMATQERVVAQVARKSAAEHALAAESERARADGARESEDARRIAMVPAERKLVEHVEALAKSRGEPYGATLMWAMNKDATTKALYAVAQQERFS